MSSCRIGDAIDIGSPNQKARHLSTGVTSLNVSKSNESTVFVPAVPCTTSSAEESSDFTI